MFVELVEWLRCPNEHADAWLVAASRRTQARDIIDGVLGCPVCGAEYPIVGGVALFGSVGDATRVEVGEPGGSVAGDAAAGDAPGHSRSRADAAVHDPGEEPSPDSVMRAAAMLGLTEAGGFAVLCGSWGTLARELHRMTRVQLLLVDAPEFVEPGEGVSLLRTGNRLPLAAGSARATAVDASTARLLQEAARVVRAGGRVIAPSGMPVPHGLTELARDNADWVAEAGASLSAPIPLRRAR